MGIWQRDGGDAESRRFRADSRYPTLCLAILIMIATRVAAAPTPTPTCSCRPECLEVAGGHTDIEPNGPQVVAESGQRSGSAAFGIDVATLARYAGPAAADAQEPTPTEPIGWYLNTMNVPAAWAVLRWPTVPMEQHDVKIALLDTGVNAEHPDLAGRISDRRRNVATSPPSTDVSDALGHGTRMAGIIAAIGGNGDGVDGIMWGVKILPCKMTNQVADGGIEKGIECLKWVSKQFDEGEKIVAVNYSFQSQVCSCEMEREIRRLRDRGVLLVAAAANEAGRDNDATDKCPAYPASYPLSNVIAVTAVGAGDLIKTSSSFGKRSVHVAAPSSGERLPVLDKDGGATFMFGSTSTATAEVTGVLALLKAQDRQRDWRALRNLLLAGGVPMEDQADHDQLISGRKVLAVSDPTTTPPGTGSMSCEKQAVRRRLLPVADKVTPGPDGKVYLRALSIDCAAPAPVPVQVIEVIGDTDTPVAGAQPSTVDLHDDGVPPDDFKGGGAHGDGEWAGVWVPPTTPGKHYRLTFWGGNADALSVMVP